MLFQSAIHWQEVVPIRQRLRYGAETMIVNGTDDAERSAYVVLEGMVRLSLLTSDGREQVMVYLTPGSLFGEQAALGRTKIGADLVAFADEVCEIGQIAASDLAAALNRDADPFREIMRLTSEKTALFVQAVARSSFGSARSRVADVLGALGQKCDHVAITQERLAHLCGTTRVTVAAQLRTLVDEGAITMQRNGIIIRDQNRLAQTPQ